MAIGLNPKVNPYPGNPYLYGYGPEHRWFSYGDIAPPAVPGGLPVDPQNPPQDRQTPSSSLFEGDGARDNGEGVFQTPGSELEWEPMTGPKMSDVMAALAAAGQPNVVAGPEMRVDSPQSFSGLESFAGYGAPGEFADDVGMMADRAAEEMVLGDRAMTRAHEFEEPAAPVGALSAPAVEAPAAPGVSVGQTPGGFEVSGQLGNTGLRGGASTDLRGWGENFGGQGQGALAGLAESIIGEFATPSTNPAEKANSPAGQAALSFTEGLLSRSPDQFGKFGEDKATNAFTTKGSIAGTHDYMSSLVDPGKVAAAAAAQGLPAEYGYAPPAPAYGEELAMPGYTPGELPSDLPTVDQELIDNTPSFDEQGNLIDKASKVSGLENLIDFTHLAEIVDPSVGALGLAGLDEAALAAAQFGNDDLYGDYSDGLYGGTGSWGGEHETQQGYGGYDAGGRSGGVSDAQIAGLIESYNDQAPAVGQPSPIEGFTTAIEAMQAANEGKLGGYDPAGRGEPGPEYTGSSGAVGGSRGSDKQGATGQDKGDTGGGTTDGGGCYITTAAVDHMKLKDDGAHLQVLRWYRDNVLAKAPDGRKQISEYKKIAPKIVSSLNKRKDAPEIYKALFTSYIDPAAQAVVKGDYADADNLYSSMVKQVADLSD